MFQQLGKNLFLFRDTCNVYVLRAGHRALLVDFGDGGVLNALASLGITEVEHILFTHHHREQCQGAARIKGHPCCQSTIISAPEAERVFFEHPQRFRKMHATLDDPFSCLGASFLRPPRVPILLDRTFAAFDEFNWRGYEFWTLSTPGNSPGAMTYLLRHDNEWLAFSGDVILDGAHMHTWFDSEWDYGYGAGLYALYSSAFAIERFQPRRLYPSHGEPIGNPEEQLPQFRQKLKAALQLYLRDWDEQFAVDAVDTVSIPSAVPHLWQISPHLYKFTGTGFGGNFHMLLADSGHALVIDCGLWQNTWLDERMAQIQERLSLKQIDAVIVTHMHGDHILNCEHLRQKYGAKIWTLDSVAELFEHPERFDYSALVSAYAGHSAVKIDRTFERGEVLSWESYNLTFDWLPGQTEFALVLHGEIDDRLVAFTGDNIFGSRERAGHDALVARNSALLERGYLYCAEYLARLQPDLILAGHSVVIEKPASQIERYRQWALLMREALQSLSSEQQYEYFFDPYWVRAYPYRSSATPGSTVALQLDIRHYGCEPEEYHIEIRAPRGWTVTPAVINASGKAGDCSSHPLQLTVPESQREGVVEIVTFDIIQSGKHYGEYFDAMIEVKAGVPL